jgi:hypothetical protein
MEDGFEMSLVPGFVPHNPDLVNGNIPCLRAAAVDRNGQPLFPMRGFDLIPVPPAALVVLDIIIKNKQVGAPNLIENSPPGDIGRLQNDDVHLPATS